MLVVLTVSPASLYPLVVTGVAQVAFPHQANGSLIERDGKARRLGADRPAVRRPEVLLEPALGDVADPVQRRRVERLEPGTANPALADAVKARIEALRDADPRQHGPVPVDLVTASASGLDPHI